MQGKTDLSYFPDNPYKHSEPRIVQTRAMRRQIRQSWTTAPAWWIRLRRVFLRRKPRPEPPFALAPYEPKQRRISHHRCDRGLKA